LSDCGQSSQSHDPNYPNHEITESNAAFTRYQSRGFFSPLSRSIAFFQGWDSVVRRPERRTPMSGVVDRDGRFRGLFSGAADRPSASDSGWSRATGPRPSGSPDQLLLRRGRGPIVCLPRIRSATLVPDHPPRRRSRRAASRRCRVSTRDHGSAAVHRAVPPDARGRSSSRAPAPLASPDREPCRWRRNVRGQRPAPFVRSSRSTRAGPSTHQFGGRPDLVSLGDLRLPPGPRLFRADRGDTHVADAGSRPSRPLTTGRRPPFRASAR